VLPDDRRRLKRASERAYLYQPVLRAQEARKKAAELFRLLASSRSQGRILLALETAIAIPLRFSVTNKVDLSTKINRLQLRPSG
jgi:hypothetical protein